MAAQFEMGSKNPGCHGQQADGLTGTADVSPGCGDHPASPAGHWCCSSVWPFFSISSISAGAALLVVQPRRVWTGAVSSESSGWEQAVQQL